MGSSIKLIALSILIILLCVSCGSYNYFTTKFSHSSLDVGDNFESIIDRFGKPYSTDCSLDKSDTLKVLSYKEIMAHGYILKTRLYFKNSILFKIEQSEYYPSDIILKEIK